MLLFLSAGLAELMWEDARDCLVRRLGAQTFRRMGVSRGVEGRWRGAGDCLYLGRGWTLLFFLLGQPDVRDAGG